MGSDVSFHPIDLDLVLNRAVPFVLGAGSLDDIILKASRTTRIRLRAKEWAMGLLAHRIASRPQLPPTGDPAALLDWLSIVEDGFDEDLQVWGRPFLITASNASDAVESYERFLECSPDDVDALVGEQLEGLDPDGAVEPSHGVGELGDPRLTWEAGWKMTLFREAFAAHARGQPVTITSEIKVQPAELFAAEFALSLISFMSHLYPGWSSRGNVWPSLLFGQAGIDSASRFQTCRELYEPLIDLFPDISAQLGTTLGVSTRLGGYLSPVDVPVVLDDMQRQRQRLLDLATEEGWSEQARQEIAKIEETLLFCARNGLAFLEVSDLYSPAFGITC